ASVLPGPAVSYTTSRDSTVAIYEGQRVELSPREAMLLRMLVDDGGRVLSRDEIVDQVWRGQAANPRAVDVAVFRLRTRLKRIGHPGIQTVFGRGYRLAA
ncbi:MAG: winged helix-turn-helix domain-containing protein, partial [Chloroflexi bacterium]|nr:winged helix-turn-helix domain-containing protein [Chloroflexota bacterium]